MPSATGRPSLPARLRLAVERDIAIRPGEHLLVACSGGPDSVALLDLLARHGSRWGFRLSAASVDHGLRPEAAEDVETARRLAERHGIPFHALRLRLSPGGDLQARARDARYAALLARAEAIGADAIVTGHHHDDQAETVLLRLLRGAGVSGLGAMAVRRPLSPRVDLARPLLEASRAEIIAYLRHHGLAFRLDPSNRDPRHLRVRIREELLPLLVCLDPAVTRHLTALAEEAREMDAWRRRRAEALLRRSRIPDGSLRCAPLREAPIPLRREAIRRWLGEVLSPERVRRTHVLAIERLLDDPGEVRLPGGRYAGREGDMLHLAPPARTSSRTESP